jgi:hypothetical protein
MQTVAGAGVVVTGIGAALARRFAADGARAGLDRLARAQARATSGVASYA